MVIPALSRDPEGTGLRLGGRNDDGFGLNLAPFQSVPYLGISRRRVPVKSGGLVEFQYLDGITIRIFYQQ
jgi:hypothetical protein